MEMAKRFFFISAGVSLLIFAAASTGLGTALAQQANERMQPLLTRIVNTNENPVPVSLEGTGTISGNVNAAQDGIWNVNAGQDGVWNVGASQDGDWSVKQNGNWTVDVDQLPDVKLDPSGNTVQAQQEGTWNVNVTGGTLSAAPSVASRYVNFNAFEDISAFQSLVHEIPGPAIHASLVSLTSRGGHIKVTLQWLDGQGSSKIEWGFSANNGETIAIPLHQPIPVDRIVVRCEHSIFDCNDGAFVSIVGN